jgi:hypothetical protein
MLKYEPFMFTCKFLLTAMKLTIISVGSRTELNKHIILLFEVFRSLICFVVGITTAKNPDDVSSEDSIAIEPFDLNHFFGEDGKIYGYTDLKVENKVVDISLCK